MAASGMDAASPARAMTKSETGMAVSKAKDEFFFVRWPGKIPEPGILATDLH